MENGFSKGQSDNLPKVSATMMCSFYATSGNFLSAEIRGIKASRSSRDDYGDNAVGYVQVRREGNVCTVKARITPEHKVRTKPYNILFICDEAEEVVNICICEDCPASQGGCKHAVAFLSWLHRRSEEPSKTEILCYWRRSKMAEIGTSVKFLLCKDLGDPKSSFSKPKNNDFLLSVVEKIKGENVRNATFLKYFLSPTDVQKLSLHRLRLNSGFHSAAEFVEFCSKTMILLACERAKIATLNQADTEIWHELRYGRITASKIHEAAYCKTSNGSLVEFILGAKLPPTMAINRGRALEEDVFKQLKTSFPNIKKSGLLLSPNFPIFGASPDGIDNDYIFEIKCPMTDKWRETYFKDNRPSGKFYAQMQLQMKFSSKSKGIFVVATPQYEETKELIINVVDYDEHYIDNLMNRAQTFWNENIYNKLYQ